MQKYLLPLFSSVTAILLCVTVAYAGTLTPSASPAATSYTLTDIYTRLTTNATATAGDHDFAPSGSPAASMYSMTEVYEAIPTIEADRVLSGTSLLGVAGTYDIANLSAAAVQLGVTFGSGSTGTLEVGADLSDMWNGTIASFTGGALTFGGGEDYNNAGSPPSDTYVATWTTCNVGNNYCGTGDTGAAARDENTGLVWSKTMNSAGYALDDTGSGITWFVANNCAQTTGSFCSKKTSSKTGCEANDGWYLPSQKELMLAYIDGAYGNLEPAGTSRDHWSNTTAASLTSFAWRMGMGQGSVAVNSKTATAPVVRCVYSAS